MLRRSLSYAKIVQIAVNTKRKPQRLQKLLPSTATGHYSTKSLKMTQLNLPPFKARLSGTPDSPKIFDMLRRKYVALTPEESVRQHFIHFLVDHKGYPAALLANELPLTCGNKQLRADTVLYDRELHPKMIIEYKAPTIKITQRVFDQITAYNILLNVDYLVVSNGIEHYCCKMDHSNRSYKFLSTIPDYKDL